MDDLLGGGSEFALAKGKYGLEAICWLLEDLSKYAGIAKKEAMWLSNLESWVKFELVDSAYAVAG